MQKHAFIHDRYQPGRISRHQKLEQISTGSSFEGPSGPSFFTFAEDYSSANIFQLFSREGKKEKKRKLETRGNQLITETTQILKQSANQHININISYGHTCPAQKVHKAPRFKLTLQGSKTTVDTVQNTEFIRNPRFREEPSLAATVLALTILRRIQGHRHGVQLSSGRDTASPPSSRCWIPHPLHRYWLPHR